jgi:hypothetical protein
VFGVDDCVAHRVGLAVTQPTEWQHIGNEINAAFIFARANVVSVDRFWNLSESQVSRQARKDRDELVHTVRYQRLGGHYTFSAPVSC